MSPIELAIAGVEAAVRLAQAVISALSKSEEERQAHLVELDARLEVTRGRVTAEAAATKKALENLPPE